MSELSLKHLIVGAGLGGLLTAKAFEEAGTSCNIYEKSAVLGGMWNLSNEECALANQETTVETDPICYGLPDEACVPASNADGFTNYHLPQCHILLRMERYKANLQTPVTFNRCVTGYDVLPDGTIMVTSMDTTDGTEFKERFAGLHFRNGSLSKQFAKKEMYPGQSIFQGQVVHGVAEDVSLKTLTGKNVVVVGFGPFAIENVKRALMASANSITLVARRRKFHLFDAASYFMLKGFQSPSVADPQYIAAVWDQALTVNQTLAEATGTMDMVMAAEVMRMVAGKRHVVIRDGLFSCTTDIVALGVHYGLVDYHVDTIDHFTADGVVCKCGVYKPCDILIQCFGFECEASQSVLKGRTITDGLWVDGLPNVTSNAGHLKIRGHLLLGPNSPGYTTILPSNYFYYTFAVVIERLMRNKQVFNSFMDFKPFSSMTDAEYPSFKDLLDLFNKIFAFDHPDVTGPFAADLKARAEAYAQHLDEQTFLRLDCDKWEKICAVMAERTGKLPLSYPLQGLIH